VTIGSNSKRRHYYFYIFYFYILPPPRELMFSPLSVVVCLSLSSIDIRKFHVNFNVRLLLRSKSLNSSVWSYSKIKIADWRPFWIYVITC